MSTINGSKRDSLQIGCMDFEEISWSSHASLPLWAALALSLVAALPTSELTPCLRAQWPAPIVPAEHPTPLARDNHPWIWTPPGWKLWEPHTASIQDVFGDSLFGMSAPPQKRFSLDNSTFPSTHPLRRWSMSSSSDTLPTSIP
ncbi:hypothetical protein EDD15DRAFT_2204602 [Pisolithus albus]|nr:hypothetical protein EDD15DRAFT_2204602 [Pisolithus albus]